MTGERGCRALLAEFDDPEALLAAARALAWHGYSRLHAYSPMHVEGLAAALSRARAGERGADEWGVRIARLSFAGGLLGGLAIFVFQTWAMAFDWTLNVGGREPFSWPAFVVSTFECAILGAALTAFASFMILSGFPRPHHPIFELEAFERASADRMFVAVEAGDPSFEYERTRRLLASLEPMEVHELRA